MNNDVFYLGSAKNRSTRRIDPNEWIPVQVLASRLGIKPGSVHQRVHIGKLPRPYYPAGGRNAYFKVSELKAKGVAL